MHTTLASTNDNIFARQLYRDEPECLPYGAAARYLIKKYVSAYWKHDCTDLDYVSLEMTLCRYIMMKHSDNLSRELKIRWLARILEVSPVRLLNDPDLPL